ncbi:MAG TPA: PadR family transcriptional regulator, partial [Myxococcaceae bacterium]|nr:PadR family transcriptional regulator [Myxococcaceae bacterium]
MSPVFRHGSLRLYLLKLLDEAPRHGYEVIRLLQDRFLGVYAPSPGTIYPRLARLEEEGLVTHDETDGKKVYRITDKGREELHARLDDLAELEEEITASVRDIAREVSEDVRETVRSLREELASAARDMSKGRARDAGQSAQQETGQARGGKRGKGRAKGAWDEAGDVWERAAQAEDEPEDEADQGRGGRGGRGWSD